MNPMSMSAPNQGDGSIPLVQGVIDPVSSSSPPVATASAANASAPPAPYNPSYVYYPPSQLPPGQYYGGAHAPVQQTIDQPLQRPFYGQEQYPQQQPPSQHQHYPYLQQQYHPQQHHPQQQHHTQEQYHPQQQHHPQQQQMQMGGTLADTKRLIVKQKFEPLEALANAAANAINMGALGNLGEIANKYDVFTDDGGDKFRVIEQSDYFGCTGRCCCNPNHQLRLHVYAPDAVSRTREVMVFDRPCKIGQCCSCCDICQQEMIAYDGDSGNQIGYIKQPFLGGGLAPSLQVMDREGDEPYATIQSEAMCCIAGLCCDHTFIVKDAHGDELGKIVKMKPSSLGQFSQELVSDADVFSIEFRSKDLDIRKKATLFGALHLIDYMFFENEGQGSVDLANERASYKCCDLYCCGCVIPCSCDCACTRDM